MPSSTKSVLVVLTNSNTISSSCPPGDKCCTTPSSEQKTVSGFDIKEVAYIYLNLCKKMKLPITFATPHGGMAPVDPSSKEETEKDSYVREFLRDTSLLDRFHDTKPLSSINPEEYSIVLIPGKYATMVDLASNDTLCKIIDAVYFKNRGIIGTIGHGVCALFSCQSEEKDKPKASPLCKNFLKGRRCTGPTNEEEKILNIDHCLPYLIEDRLRECGAHFESAHPFSPFVVVDERLVTGQNSSSVSLWIERISSLIESCH
ncbi:hypothetical protein MDAP_000422 [Mitosporidium daphniae]